MPEVLGGTLMKVTPRRDSFICMTNERYEADTDIFCAVCGRGIYRSDRVEWDKRNEICHEKCVEDCAKL